jgi:hypothetical protein
MSVCVFAIEMSLLRSLKINLGFPGPCAGVVACEKRPTSRGFGLTRYVDKCKEKLHSEIRSTTCAGRPNFPCKMASL